MNADNTFIIVFFNLSGVFYVMSLIALVGSVFCYCFLPETKNKTLEEIETLFKVKETEKLKTVRYRTIVNGQRQELKE